MEKFVKQSLLFDFYGELLTKHQQLIYKDAVFNDFSASEIAKNEGITRQGVHDLIKRCNTILDEYEERLHLVERFLKIKQQIKEIQRLAKINDVKHDSGNLKKIDLLAADILEEL